MSFSRLVLTVDTSLPVTTLRDILSDSSTRKLPFARKVINFFLALSAGARSAVVRSGVVASTPSDATYARQLGTFTGSPTANETISVNGVLITFVASASPANNQVSLAGSPSATTLAARLAAAINASTTVLLSGVVNATSSGAVTTVSALIPGVIGNSIPVGDSATNFSWFGGATNLAGGTGKLPNLSTYISGYNPPTAVLPPPVLPLGPTAVNLNSAAPFAILTKSGITDIPTSAVTGDVGTSPITGAAITGLTTGQVTGTIYCVDNAGPAGSVNNPALLTAAVSDMQAAYVDAAGRTSPDFTELGAGNIGGLTLVPGLYKWSTGVTIPTSVTLAGGANDTWIFQIAGSLTQSNATNVVLSGGAQSKNVFWQVASGATLGTTAHMEGTILSLTTTIMNTNATINGRLLAQTAATLDQNTVTKPV